MPLEKYETSRWPGYVMHDWVAGTKVAQRYHNRWGKIIPVDEVRKDGDVIIDGDRYRVYYDNNEASHARPVGNSFDWGPEAFYHKVTPALLERMAEEANQRIARSIARELVHKLEGRAGNGELMLKLQEPIVALLRALKKELGE
jgi:hypothetical protein